MTQLFSWGQSLGALAQAGLTYSRDPFDIERFEEIRRMSIEMIAAATGESEDTIREIVTSDAGYPTPKIDTRAVIVGDGKVLLVQENDGRWSLPGGWCEQDLSPAVSTQKEVSEEAGLDVDVTRLIAVQDRKLHNKPDYIFGVTKMFFECVVRSGEFAPNTETIDAQYFDVEDLPELAEEKTSTAQVKMCVQAALDPDWTTIFD